MGWPYEFQSLSKEDRQARRLVLDRYGRYAEFLVLLPALIALTHRLVFWVLAKVRGRIGGVDGPDGGGAYNAIPNSPSLKSRRLAGNGHWAAFVRRAQWWLSDDVVILGQTWGQRDQWVFGAAWTAILLVLCILETGRDYLHLTKRFGIVATSQFPVHYILALKSINPFAYVFRSSHEQLNRWHRVLGVIIYSLLLLHTIFYLNYFSHDGGIVKRLFRPVVAVGIISIFGMTLLSTTALSIVRRFSYRVFFITHVVVSFMVPILILYHARSSNPYMASALLFIIADLCMRKIHTVTTQATVEAIPGTDLVRLSAPIPASKLAPFHQYPASHIYMSLPPDARPSPSPWDFSYWLYEFVFNPFTIASVNEDARDLTLVVRTHKGPMTSALSRHSAKATLPSSFSIYDDEDDNDIDGKSDEEAETTAVFHGQPQVNGSGNEDRFTGTSPSGQIPVNIEGPYGTTAHFPELSARNFDRVLLVAGGVGATFAVPLYRAILHDSPGLKVDLVWSVRGAGDATWAVMSGQDGSGQSLLSDKNVHIFLTGTGGRPGWLQSPAASSPAIPSSSSSAAGIELGALHSSDGSRFGANRQRPDLQRVVDDIFRNGNEDRVAVMACGPEAMVQDLRKSVGVWVKKGRTVWWHNESFGW